MFSQMRILRDILLTFTLSLYSFYLSAQNLPVDEAVPGGIVKIDLEISVDDIPNKPKAYFQEKQALVFAHNDNYYALVGLPLTLKPGEYSIKYTNPDGIYLNKTFDVKAKKYDESRITIKNKNMVNPDPTTQSRIINDNKKVSQAINSYSSTTLPKLTMQQPVRGIPSTSFGARRIINGQKKNPHSGMDIAAAKSTPVHAAAEGKVVLADSFYLSGNMVVIDHGSSLFTLYAHLSEILVEEGETVAIGDMIGRVGNTGRVTGPHLHWTVKLNQTSVNPALFLEKINSSSKGFAGL